jgi:hypothetical protein
MRDAGAGSLPPAARPEDDGAALETARARWLPWLFAGYAAIGVLFLACATPPFQVPDEPNHFLRADQVARGQWVGRRVDAMGGGGEVAPEIRRLAALYGPLPFHPQAKTDPDQARAAAALRWSGAVATAGFGNTVNYGPLLYLPQALGIIAGRALGLTVVQTLMLSRIVNGFAAIATGACALWLCLRGRALAFTVLLLPMTLGQLGSVSQDALLITVSMLAVAVASRGGAHPPPSLSLATLFVGCVAVAAMGRLPQIGLAALGPLLIARRDPAFWRKLALAAVALGLVFLWARIGSHRLMGWPANVSVAGQLAFLRSQPAAALAIAWNTLAGIDASQWKEIVGVLGWLDTPMPLWYYPVAAAAACAALFAGTNPAPWLRPALLAALVLVATLALIAGALYLIWTPVGAPFVAGLQGRYLLPLLPLLGWLTPGSPKWLAPLRARLWAPVLLFPLVTLAVLPVAIIDRYYGSWAAMAACLRALLW